MRCLKNYFSLFFSVIAVFCIAVEVQADNIRTYSDTLSNSAPLEGSNHTFEFILDTDVSPGAYFEFDWPIDFIVSTSTETFAERNVEMYVNNVARTAAAATAPGIDGVSITRGNSGSIRYTLEPGTGISSGSNIEFRIGNHTSGALGPSTSFSTSTGTTTSPGDQEPIINATTTGTFRVNLDVVDGVSVADAGFVIALIDAVRVPSIDTTEEIPPFRFNGSPTSTVAGTTPNVEISLETDEFAFCRFSTDPDIDFTAMTEVFTNTGLVFHSTVVPVTPGNFERFYIRCIDDEDNFNITDFIIAFQVDEVPTGTSNTDGSTVGDGTGTGDSGTGSGGGGGGTSGASDGEEPVAGGDSGSGGSGGGGGGGSGGSSGSRGGGGFESTDGPFESGDGRVIISGFAFPDSDVTFLIDGEVLDTINADGDGSYEVTLDEIARGAYNFGIYAEGDDGVRSSTFSTSFTVTGARTSELSNINVVPSINVEPDPVDPGQTLTVSGFALPNAEVTIENGLLDASAAEIRTVTSDGNGRWSTTYDTSSFSRGTYQIRARAEQTDTLGRNTTFSDYTFYGVGQTADVPLNTDLNRDGSVNLTDFSILLFWWNSNGGDSDPPADINQDGRVSLTDFSILLFNWTG